MSKALGTTEDPTQTQDNTRVVSGITSTAASTLEGETDNGEITRAPSAINHHVDIAEAKEGFAALQRRITQTSLAKAKEAGDAEKGDYEDEFDLKEYFTASNEANEQSGIHRKNLGVTWKDLTVQVIDTGSKFFVGGLPAIIADTLTFPVMFPLNLIRSKVANPPTRPILQNFNGVLRPGEMCLVLGVPGSGCSTFLKTIANQRGEYTAVSGEVKYAGIDHEEMLKKYSGEVVYNQEDDIHIPTLTVEQTLEFALSTKTPAKRPSGISGKEFNKELMDTLLKMLNIVHTRQTLVGNAFVRGVSGGERKRVSILEMMATHAHVVSYDNATRGLDASTALDFARSLRVTTDILGQTTFVSLYQASESIYELFDKVMVIDAGRCVYYGPATEARQYFVSLGFRDMPRQSSADYLTACTDPNERQVASGVDKASVPSSPEELEAAFTQSKYFTLMEDDRADYERTLEAQDNRDQEEFRMAVLDAKKKRVSKKNPYTLGFVGQVKALTIRQFRLQLQDRFTLYSSMTIAWGTAIIIGATFYNLPTSTSGGFTRGSVIFLAMILNALDAFGEMPTQMVTRPIFLKQTAYKLFRPAALSIANTVADIPFSLTRVFIFNVILYFMTGLYRSGGAFWTFHLLVWMAFLTMQAIFRTIGVLCPNFDSAFRVAVFVVPNLISYSGYLIPRKSMQVFLYWIYYINPMAYAFNGLMENEFKHVNLECDGNYVTPRNAPGQTTYPSTVGPNQVCTFFGGQPAQEAVQGSNYIDVGYGLQVSDLWKENFVVILAMFIIFQFLQAFVMEKVYYGAGGGVQIFVKENKETKARNDRLRELKENPELHKESENKFQPGKTLTWKDVHYTVPVPGGTRRLLSDVTGYVKSGQLVALMGASGAGKTTLLDVLAQRKNIGVIGGEMLLEGGKLSTSFARETAYAEQMDVHEPTTTVREAMRFSAYLRQPYTVSQEEKDDYVESIIELLELQELSEALVLTLGVEARKRLTIGVELASKPSALLFLDEPTSGLDAQSAFNLVRFLRKLAAAGQSIICTIHQPSALLFENFDRLLLLQRGGETVYFGDIGQDSHVIREYFSRNGADCPPDVNPAEFMLEAIGAGSGRRIGSRDWHDIWKDSPEFARVVQDVEELKTAGVARGLEDTAKPTTYATPLTYQLRLVCARALRALWRMPDYTWTRIFVHIFLSLSVSLTFLNLGHSVRDLEFRVFAVFWVSILPAIVVNQIEPAFIINRMTFIREASSGMYSPYVFAMGQLLAELPWSIVCAILYWVLNYFPMDFGQGATGKGGSGYYLLMIIASETFGVCISVSVTLPSLTSRYIQVTMGQAIASLSPTIKLALLTNPPISLILTTFAGVTIPYPQLAKFWKYTLYQISPYTRIVAGLTTNELHGLVIQCQPDEFAVFEPPSGQTCQQWAGEFVDNFGGYLNNANATSACQYCQYKVGDEFFANLNMTFEHRWRDLGIVFAFCGFNMIVTLVASRYLRYAKR
ncbi:hypothetical protein FRB94_012414 [Tulasnella sp. JGI-2019a]|nr:hypothetical protein FRB94_012414 [Tulasnella sp. JGI-2019a]